MYYRNILTYLVTQLLVVCDSKVRVLYGGNDVFDYEVGNAFWHDIRLAIISVITIIILMFILSSFSIWLTFWGFVTIVLSFPLAYFFYRVVFSVVALGMLNGAAAFVIIGIGKTNINFINLKTAQFTRTLSVTLWLKTNHEDHFFTQAAEFQVHHNALSGEPY